MRCDTCKDKVTRKDATLPNYYGCGNHNCCTFNVTYIDVNGKTLNENIRYWDDIFTHEEVLSLYYGMAKTAEIIISGNGMYASDDKNEFIFTNVYGFDKPYKITKVPVA